MDLSTLGPILVSVVTAILTVGAGLLVARRFRGLGGGEAQERLNSTYKETNANLLLLNEQLDARTKELLLALDERTAAFKDCKAELDATAKTTRRERLALQQDIDDLREDLRAVRRAARASDARQDTSDKRQDASDKRQTHDEHKAVEHAESPPLTPDVHPEPA